VSAGIAPASVALLLAQLAAVWPLSLGAAGAAALAGLAAWSWPRKRTWGERVLSSRRRRLRSDDGAAPGTGWLALAGGRLPRELRARIRQDLDRAGYQLGPEELLGRLLAAEAALLALATLLVVTISLPVQLLMVVAVPPLIVAGGVQRSARRRRASILGELPLLVDLMALEQAGGGLGARRAMELVVARSGGPAAAIIRDCLTRSATPGSPPLDGELERAAVRYRVAALSALAAVVRIQRAEGIATGAPLGNLARGLRDRQRDRVTEEGRRALVAMLLPVAACILLPFILIVLFPAISQFGKAFS
jgi:Flp pilus assembly protein TadB